MSCKLGLYFIIAFFCTSFTTNATELSVDFSTEAEYNNNIRLASTDKEDEVVQTGSLSVEVLEARKSLQINANFLLEKEHYYNDTFSGETSMRAGFGLFNFDLVESFLSWKTSFTRTELLSDAADTDTPDSREYRNILRSGPTISYNISKTTRVDLLVNYINVENSDDDVSDSERLDSSFSFSNSLNRITDLSFGAKYGESIDADEGDEYANANIYIEFVRRFSHGNLQLSIGRTKLMPEDSASTEGSFYNVLLNKEQVLLHDISFEYQQDISETSIGFESDEEGVTDVNSPLDGHVSSDVVMRKRLVLGVDRNVGSYNYTVSGFWEEETLVIQDDDEKSYGLNFRFENQIYQDLISGFEYAYRINDFIDRPSIREDKTVNYRVYANYVVSTDLSVSGFVGFGSRSNSKNDAREYEELSTGLGLKWALY